MSKIASNAEDGIWETLPWQIGIMLALADLDIPDVGIQKPTQRGLSMILLGLMLYNACYRKRNVGNWQPRDADARRFGLRHVKSSIDNIPEVAAKLLSGAGKRNDPNNSVMYTAFHDAYIQISPAQKDQDFRADSLAEAYIDEADGMPLRVAKGEGNERGSSPFELVKGRMDAEDYPKRAVVSTARVKGSSNIENFLKECRELFHWFLPCPRCDLLQETVWGAPAHTGSHGVIWDEVLDDEGLVDEYLSSKTARYRCCDKNCNHEFGFAEILRQNKYGYWQSDNLRLDHHEYRYLDRKVLEQDNQEQVIDKPPSVGFQFPGYFSGTGTALEKGVEGWLFATRMKRAGDDRPMIRWKNEYEAVTVDQSAGVMRIEGSSLLTLRKPIHGIPNEIQYLTMFWDFNRARGTMGMLCGWSAGQQCWILEYHHLPGDPTGHKKQVWEVTSRHRQKNNTNSIAVSFCGLDTGYNVDFVREVAEKDPVMYVLTKGHHVGKKPIFAWSGNNERNDEALAMIGTDTAKKYFYNRLLQDKEELIGKVRIPDNLEFADAIFCDGLVAEQLVHVWKDGKNPDEEWRRVSQGIDNEPLDCVIGNYAGIYNLQEEFGFNLLDQEPMQSMPSDEEQTGRTVLRQDSETLIEKYSEAPVQNQFDASSMRSRFKR